MSLDLLNILQVYPAFGGSAATGGGGSSSTGLDLLDVLQVYPAFGGPAATGGGGSSCTYYTMSGPATGWVGFSSDPFTVTLGPGTLAAPVTITPNDGAGGGSFSPSSVVLTNTSRSAVFSCTEVTSGAKAIGVSNSGGLTDPANLTFLATNFPAPPSSGGLTPGARMRARSRR